MHCKRDQFDLSTGTSMLLHADKVFAADLGAFSQLTVPLGLNFALWGVAVISGYLVIRQVGISHGGPEKAAEQE